MSNKQSFPPSQAQRSAMVCIFIEELHALKNFFPKTPDQLRELGATWEIMIRGIPTHYLRERDENSLFCLSAAAGLTEAAQVWNLWVATRGGAMASEAQRKARHDNYAQLAAAAEPHGPARQEMLNFLYSNGVTEAMLGGSL